MTTETQHLRRDGLGALAYDVQGEGPLLLLVPGMGDLRGTYRFLAPVLVAAGYRVATTDLRGHGDSEAHFPAYGDIATASDIADLIRELGGPAVVVGNSMAAGAAVIAAAEHPELVSGLVLVGPFVRDPGVGVVKTLLFRLLMARPWAVAAWKAYLPTLYAGAQPADFDEYRDAVVASMRRPGYARAFSLTTRTEHATAEAKLPAVSAPTLVVMGEKDPDFPNPRAEAEWVAAALRGEVAMAPEAGHYPHAQQPERVASAVLGFLRTLAGQRA
ncbi:alpha/beta hydrolase [Salinibacterium sp. SYSU T00001]|uniref:alpha/beta fold hydrolase n=1 Tax=Homoserinimonas sedimenticola TaxID=2986805 RepID=UPI002235D742|nr:alpha/beta hydrolase [Salinibacterium sedimenticola]MCW4386346.1 alpha/beta hydrolase [Salinibacterium sedimenticola]